MRPGSALLSTLRHSRLLIMLTPSICMKFLGNTFTGQQLNNKQ